VPATLRPGDHVVDTRVPPFCEATTVTAGATIALQDEMGEALRNWRASALLQPMLEGGNGGKYDSQLALQAMVFLAQLKSDPLRCQVLAAREDRLDAAAMLMLVSVWVKP